MKRFAFLALILAAISVNAKVVAVADKGDKITLHDTECSIAPGALRAVYFVEKTGQEIEGCYAIQGEQVFVIFANGDQGVVEKSWFKFL